MTSKLFQTNCEPSFEMRTHRLTIVADPRFSGGTSAAVASEIRALAGWFHVSFVALETAMFKGRNANSVIESALDEMGIELVWATDVIHADTIVFHNPSCLRFNDHLSTRLSCARAFVVTHENFLRPGGSEGFDVAGCLQLIDEALVTGIRWLAPVSDYNRATVTDWLSRNETPWNCTTQDWFNIFDVPLLPPTLCPRDRRGRHSRPGPEKYPPVETMKSHFSGKAEANILLGADDLISGGVPVPDNWDLRPFGAMDVWRFLSEIDFFVYYTHPLWRESFGRVIAEAIAAGKVVITDAGTARSFGQAVVESSGDDVDDIIAAFVSDPNRYRKFVRSAQATLERFRPEMFRSRVVELINSRRTPPNALV